MKVVFLGTPEFAVPCLEALIKDQSIQVLAVVSQPDKPVGRKQVLSPPAVKVCAEKHHILVLQPENISKDKIALTTLKSIKPDILVTVAYGQILKENVLTLAPNGVVNLHSSLLPDYRGPAPMNWMIINGEKTVGVTSMDTELTVDTGDILMQAETELGENENTEELAKRLSKIGADLLVKTLHDFKKIKPIKQKYGANYPEHKKLAPFMDKKLGLIDFTQEELVLGSANPRQSDFKIVKKNNAQNIHNLVRGTYPWPGASFIHNEQNIKLLETRVCDANLSKEILEAAKEKSKNLSAGHYLGTKDNSLFVNTHDGVLEILKVKPAGKKEMTGKDWVNGTHLYVGNIV